MSLALSLAPLPGALSSGGERRITDRMNSQGKSPFRATPRRSRGYGLLGAALLACAMLEAMAPGHAAAAIAFVKTVGTGTVLPGSVSSTVAVTVPAAGVALGNTIIVTFAMDPQSGTVSCTDS